MSDTPKSPFITPSRIDIGPGVSMQGSPEACCIFAQKYAAAMLEYDGVERDREGQEGRRTFKYMTYAALAESLRPVLAKHGFAFFTPIAGRESDNDVTCTVLIMLGTDKGLAILSTSLCIDVAGRLTEGNSPMQQWGKLCSYLRRYTAQYAFGVEADHDAKGQDIEAGDNSQPPARPAPAAAPKPAPVKRETIDAIAAEMERLGVESGDAATKLAALQAYTDVSRFNDLTQEAATTLLHALKLADKDNFDAHTAERRAALMSGKKGAAA